MKKYAAVLVAYFIFAGAACAQDVTFRDEGGGFTVSGRFVAYDADTVTLVSAEGLVSFRAAGLVCDGAACPDLEAFVPLLRMVGAERMARLLMPALISVYARDQGWVMEETEAGLRLLDQTETVMLDISLDAADSRASFEAFVDHRADVLLSMRELRTSEIDAAFEAGLGRVTSARQARIVALDALVPVVPATSGLRFITIAEITRAFSGQETQFTVSLPETPDSQLEGFEDRFLRMSGLKMIGPDAANPLEQSNILLSLKPFRFMGNAQPLALSGPCGLVSEARFLAMKTEDYPLTFPIFLYLPQRILHPQIEAFLDWMRSPSAQLVIRRAGFVDLAAVPIPLATQGDRLANAIASAGPEVSLAELQRLVRLMGPRERMSSTFRFEPGSTRLDGQSRSNVMQLAQAIHDGQFGGRELMFVGFSDGRGPADANRDLSSARAEAVRRDVERALGANMPDNVLIDTDAFGEAMPMACDDTIWGQQTNRRVELWVRDAD